MRMQSAKLLDSTAIARPLLAGLFVCAALAPLGSLSAQEVLEGYTPSVAVPSEAVDPAAPPPTPRPLDPVPLDRPSALTPDTRSAPPPPAPPPLPAPYATPAPQSGTATPSTRADDAPELPAPVARPLAIDPATDPILILADRSGDAAYFTGIVKSGVRMHPSIDEAQALARQAQEVKDEAESAQYPQVEVGLSSYRVIAQSFRNELDNLLQRARPNARTDITGNVTQRLIDFGATVDRISSAESTIQAALADVDNVAAQLALNTIGAWYDLFAARTLLQLTSDYRESVAKGADQMRQRIEQGQSAPADMARVDTELASLDVRAARYRRQVASAEARFQELTGQPVPEDLGRAPLLGSAPITREGARIEAENIPAVRSARAQARAAEKAAEAAREDTLPLVTAQVAAGRYGAFEVSKDYDVRAIVNVRQLLFGPGDARADQARERSRASDARAVRVREESGRDAAIAFSDLKALEAQLQSLKEAYIASRTTRDAISQRFRYSRGSLLDVLAANDTYFAAAAAYVDGLTQRDAAYYVLLARTGRLLGALDIRPTTEMMLSE